MNTIHTLSTRFKILLKSQTLTILLSMVIMPTLVVAADVSLSLSNSDTDSASDIFDFGAKTIDGATSKAWGYDLILSGTENQTEIRGSVNAIVGPANGEASWTSWEVLRIHGMPSVESYYDWTLNVDVTITSADNPSGDKNYYSDSVYGILLHNYNAGNTKYNHITEVASTVTIKNYQGLVAGAGSPAETMQGTAYGVELGAYYDVKTLSSIVNITNASSAIGYQFNAGTRVGVDSDGNAIEGAGITGLVTLTNVTEGVGLLYSGTGDINTGAEEPIVGYNSAQIRIVSDADYAVRTAVGIFVNGEGADNDIQGALTGIFNGNIDIDVHYDDAAISTNQNAIVTGIQIIQKEGYVDDLEHIVFGDGASISAKYQIAGDSSRKIYYGDAINLEASQIDNKLNLTTQYDADEVTLEGNIRAFYENGAGERVVQDLSFEQGVYHVTADTFEASSITLGSHDPILDMMSDATLNLYESLAVKQVEHVDFYLQSYRSGEYSSINVAESKTLMLDSANNINIYLGEDLMGFSLYKFDLIAGDVTGLGGITFSIFDGTKSGEEALLWSFTMEEGYKDYQSLATVTSHYFEVKYTENGVTLVARIPNLFIPEPSMATLSLIALSMTLLRRRRRG